MELHWKEIIPADQYTVVVDGPPNEDDSRVLMFLYQPLIGPVCISMYMTLRHQVEKKRLKSKPVSHYYIMNLLNLSLADIYRARQKLEAIGLMESYVKNDQDPRLFLYKLKPPLSPARFFSDGLLNIYLYQKVGREYYNRLKKEFADTAVDMDGFKNITKPFQQVFRSSSAIPYTEIHDPEEETAVYPHREEAAPVTISSDYFDFELFMAGLDEAIVPKRAITKEVREAILKLSFLYGIDAIQMKNIVLSCITDTNEIDIEKLRKAARDWYQIEHYQSLPQLVDRTQSPIYQSEIDVPKTKEERLIRYLETVSPRQVLADLSEGSEPAASDLRLVEDIMINQKLPPGVVNVLIHYCMLRTDMKLSKAFAEKIASHWARKKVKTVKEAMELAKKEHRQYTEWQKSKKQRAGKRFQPVRSEKVPEWLENRDKPLEKDGQDPDFERKRKELEERLKKYKK